MRKDFYVFRHGETNYNAEGRCQGCGIDTELNVKGIMQAQGLIPKLAPMNLEIIYSSPLKRAIKTAEIVADALCLKVLTEPELREVNFGAGEGKTKSEMLAAFPDIYQAWRAPENLMDIAYPDGETKRQAGERMLGTLKRLALQPYQTMGIATHGSAMRYLLAALGRDPKADVPNAALFHVWSENGRWGWADLASAQD